MNIFAVLSWVGDLLADESKHFLLAFLAGVLGYWLTLTIWYVLRLVLVRGFHRKISTGAGSGMFFLCLLLGISLAFMSHAWLDGFAIWYTAPLDPHLELIIR